MNNLLAAVRRAKPVNAYQCCKGATRKSIDLASMQQTLCAVDFYVVIFFIHRRLWANFILMWIFNRVRGRMLRQNNANSAQMHASSHGLFALCGKNWRGRAKIINSLKLTNTHKRTNVLPLRWLDRAPARQMLPAFCMTEHYELSFITQRGAPKVTFQTTWQPRSTLYPVKPRTDQVDRSRLTNTPTSSQELMCRGNLIVAIVQLIITAIVK